MEYRVGLYNENFKMASREVLEQKLEQVRGQISEFDIVLGPLLWQGKTFESTYVLEIHYHDSEDAHTRKLFINGFNSHLPDDYVVKVNELAEKFCKEKDLIINTHLNSWPEYQAVVSKK
jgi:hypothetical protein